MGESGRPIPDGEDLSISLARANVHTLAVSLPLVGLMLLAYLGLSPAGVAPTAALTLPSTLLFLVVLVAGILTHEAIHGLAWAFFGRLPLRRIRFGFQASTLTPYAHALDPLPARAYRLGAVLPALLLGGLPFLVGTIVGSPSLALFGMIFVFAAGGDLLVLWLIRAVDARALVQDHPSRAGCIVLPHAPAERPHARPPPGLSSPRRGCAFLPRHTLARLGHTSPCRAPHGLGGGRGCDNAG